MEKVIINNHNGSDGNNGYNGHNRFSRDNKHLIYNARTIRDNFVTSLPARLLAIGIFLFFFIEAGTLGIVPRSFYMVYRSVRISDFILYGLIIYSFFCYDEYKDLFKSKSFLLIKIFLFYLVLEFFLSELRYRFNIIECFFRLKAVWSSFLIFPFFLLIKRNGFMFLVKLFLPFAIISNILYIMSALTGIDFLPDVVIASQNLTEGVDIFRVYGGTFYGEIFFLGFIFYWITKKFKLYQLFLAILFILPHILAFGRAAWVSLIFSIFCIIIAHTYLKRGLKAFIRQSLIMILLLISIMIAFIKLIPESDYYLDALSLRVTQGSSDVKYSEGTYGTRINTWNDILIKYWLESNLLVGAGMHPLWVVRAENHEEALVLSAIYDVNWPAILAIYGIVGFIIALLIQFYYTIISWKLIRSSLNFDIYVFFLIYTLSKLIFDFIFTYSYCLFSINIDGLGLMNLLFAILVYKYECHKNDKIDKNDAQTDVNKNLLNYIIYSNSYKKYYRYKRAEKSKN